MTKLGSLAARIADLPSWLVGLLIALGGIGMAWWFYRGPFEWYHLAIVVAVVAVVLYLAWDGQHRLPEDPKAAVDLFGLRTLASLLMAAVGAAVVIVIAVEIVAPEEADPDIEQLIGALSAALAAALALSLVDVADKIDEPAASRAETAFKAAYDGVFTSGSKGHLAVFSNIEFQSWALHVRRHRAERVAEAWKEIRGGGDVATTTRPASGQ